MRAGLKDAIGGALEHRAKFFLRVAQRFLDSLALLDVVKQFGVGGAQLGGSFRHPRFQFARQPLKINVHGLQFGVIGLDLGVSLDQFPMPLGQFARADFHRPLGHDSVAVKRGIRIVNQLQESSDRFRKVAVGKTLFRLA